jgi:hypothetical protein
VQEAVAVTQRETVLRMARKGACSVEFLRAYIPRFGARLWELKRDGYNVEKAMCRNKRHFQKSTQFVYRIAQ